LWPLITPLKVNVPDECNSDFATPGLMCLVPPVAAAGCWLLAAAAAAAASAAAVAAAIAGAQRLGSSIRSPFEVPKKRSWC